MKLRHAAALALAGWYLMLGAPTGKMGIRDYSAPVSKWEQMGGYDTAAECEADEQEKWKLARDDGDQSGARMWLEAKCLSTDDPRLKEK